MKSPPPPTLPHAFLEAIAKRLPGARFGEPLAKHTTFKIGGPADVYVELKTEAEMADAVRLADEHGVPLTVVGCGSNLLVLDSGVRGLVLRLKGDFERLAAGGGTLLEAGAGVRLPKLIAWAGERGLGGSENLVGVPGTLGGSLVMNAGTREGEIGDIVREVRVLDRQTLRVVVLAPRELEFSYRASALDERLVVGALLELKAGKRDDIITRIREFQQKRLATQPVHTHNVGSTFKNPPGQFVGRLIERAGLKGLRVGDARVSPVHANFIENMGRAKASDVLGIVAAVRDRIRSEFGVELELEMRTVGEA